MEDAFTGYVEHGGLTDPVRIRLLICYLLDKLDIPLAAQTISDIVVDRGLANYFAISNAMSELIERRDNPAACADADGAEKEAQQ